ncbi:MAG: TetR/AcrR family transcriptional regulator [Spirochaetales bacterium]|nr:TetR/AcrR family transcriptional regulator [Candidatus Physcosoma equi]
MANKVDIRIVKTKDKLKKTLVQLLKSKTIDEISISEICSEASINRNTFYAHFSDVKGLFEDVKAEYLELFLTEIRNSNQNNDGFQKFITSILSKMKENSDVSRLLFGEQNTDSFLKTVIMFALPEELQSLSFESTNINSEDIYQFLVGGVVSIVQVWVASDFADKPENVGMKIAFFIQCFKINFRRL